MGSAICSGFVYFVQAGTGGPIKIGYAKDVAKRVAGLQVGCPWPLILLGTIEHEDARRVEGSILGALRTYRISGEWIACVDASCELLSKHGINPTRGDCQFCELKDAENRRLESELEEQDPSHYVMSQLGEVVIEFLQSVIAGASRDELGGSERAEGMALFLVEQLLGIRSGPPSYYSKYRDRLVSRNLKFAADTFNMTIAEAISNYRAREAEGRECALQDLKTMPKREARAARPGMWTAGAFDEASFATVDG